MGHELEEMYAESCPQCFRLSLEEFIRSEYLNAAGELRDALKEFTDGDVEQARSRLFELYGSNLRKGVGQVYKPTDAQKDVANYYLFNANVTKFAGFKSNYVIRVLENARQQKPEEFNRIGKSLLKTFNRYQATEYNTAVSRARTAKQWGRFMERADVLPNLQWIRTRSANPREEHLLYAGMILPKGDPFWNENQPGNLWNCKCDWIETAKGSTQAPDENEYVPPAKGLEGNPHSTGELFTDKATYIARDRNPQRLITEISNMRIKQIEDECRNWVGSTVKVDGFEQRVGFSMEGFKKFLSRPVPNKAAKNEMLLNIRRELERSTYLGELTPKPNDKHVSHLFEIVFLGEIRWVIVRQYAGKKPVLYSLSDSPTLLNFLKK